MPTEIGMHNLSNIGLHSNVVKCRVFPEFPEQQLISAHYKYRLHVTLKENIPHVCTRFLPTPWKGNG